MSRTSNTGNGGLRIHRDSVCLYLTSVAANNGSARGGLTIQTDAYNWLTAAVMLTGRFATLAVALALAGTLARKTRNAEVASGTFRTTSPIFGLLLIATAIRRDRLDVYSCRRARAGRPNTSCRAPAIASDKRRAFGQNVVDWPRPANIATGLSLFLQNRRTRATAPFGARPFKRHGDLRPENRLLPLVIEVLERRRQSVPLTGRSDGADRAPAIQPDC
jgi:hypothetical protein